MSDIIAPVVDATMERADYIAEEARLLRGHGIPNAQEIAERAAAVQFDGAAGVPVDWSRYQPIEL